jgi:hypothetical protein
LQFAQREGARIGGHLKAGNVVVLECGERCGATVCVVCRYLGVVAKS